MRLREHEDVGLDAVELAGEHLAGAAEAADHLVGDEHHVMLAADGLNLLPIALGRHDDAAGAHHGLADEGGDRVGPLLADHLVELLGEARREGLLALAREAVAPIMRAGHMLHHRQRQVEIALIDRAGP